MIANRVYRLKKEAILADGIMFPAKQELEIVTDVVYVNGNMIPPSMQTFFYKWIVENPTLFDDVTKNW